jgi:hypothetical protein
MVRPTARSACQPGEEGLRATAMAIGAWAQEHDDLLGGLQALRLLGPGAAPALEAVLAVRELRRARLSFEIFEVLAEGTGLDPRALLDEVVSEPVVQRFRSAIYGQDHHLASVPADDAG